MSASDQESCPRLSSASENSASGSWWHWGGVVAGLYLLLLLVISMPVVMAAFPKIIAQNGLPWEMYGEPVYLGLVAIIVLSQFLLLRVPVRLKFQRPVSRAALWLPVLVAAFWMGCLVLGLGLSILELVKYEGPQSWFIWGLPLIGWAVWTVIFARLARTRSPEEAVAAQSSWMLRGSILELLIAVPSHIVARGRTDCCAGFMTFFGITMGLSVMLLSFGPAVLLLYYARWKRLQGRRV